MHRKLKSMQYIIMNNIQVVSHPDAPIDQLKPFSELINPSTDDLSSKEMPKTKLNLTGIKGYSEKKKSLKMLKIKEETVNELKKAFSIFDKTELQLNHSAVLFVAQIVEDVFNKPKQGDLKREIVVDVCNEYFNGEPALVEMVLDLIFHKVIKTTLWRRNKQRAKNIAVFFLELFGPSIQTNLSSRLKL